MKIIKTIKNINREYLFAFTNILSAFGSSISYLVMILYLSSINDSSTNSYIIGIYTISTMLSMFLTGKFSDKGNKYKILTNLQIISALILLLLGTAIFYNLSNSVIYITLLSLAIISGIDTNISATILPLIVKQRNSIYKVNTVLQVGQRGSRVFVGIIAAYFITKQRYDIAFFINSFTYLISYIIYSKVFKSDIQSTSNKDNVEKVDYKPTFEFIFKDKFILMTLGLIFLLTFIFVPINTLLPYIVNQKEWGLSTVGYINSAYSFGGFGIAVILLFKNKKNKNRNIFTLILLWLISIFYLIFSLFLNIEISIISMALIGFLSLQLLIDCKSLVQINTPDYMLGKVMALMSILLKVASPIGMFISGIWVNIYSESSYFLLMSFFILCISVLFTIQVFKKRRSKYEELHNNV